MDSIAAVASEARVATTVPRRYMAQLCKHFEHRVPVTLGESQGRIAFPSGVCDVTADVDAAALVMRVTAADAAALANLEDVVARHLKRFAFREEPEVAWVRVA